MSFGASPSDIVTVVTFARRLYRQSKNAGEEHLELSREVRGLHTVLRHLKYEVEAPESILNRDRALYARELAPTIGDSNYTLRELEDLLRKYERSSHDKGSSGTKFGSAELDQLGSIRMKLINYKMAITGVLDKIQIQQSSAVPTILDNQSGQLDMILDKVDGIAARMDQRGDSFMTTYDDDDREVWVQFKRELVLEGFSSDVLQKHKDVLRAYIRQIDQNGLLEEMPLGAKSQPVVSTQQLRVERVALQETSNAPPSFESLNTNSVDTTKEMVVSEDNMKFHLSMKGERALPESGPINIDPKKQLVVPRESQALSYKEDIAELPASGPHLITSAEKTTYSVLNGALPKVLPGRSPLSLPIICTTDIINADRYALDRPRTLMLEAPRPEGRSQRASFSSDKGLTSSPAGSPVSTRAKASFAEESGSRAINSRPKTQSLAPEVAQYGTSPRISPGGLAMPSKSATYPPADRYGASPRASSSTLAPDSQGREIPPDAKWTRIRRSLISPEVLAQDGRRYEAREEFIAILGILSRDEIEEYAARSQTLRDARHRARNPVQLPPAQPPRPPPRPQELRRKRSVHFEEETFDETSSDEDEIFPNERSQTRERSSRPYHREYRGHPAASAPLHYTQQSQYGMPISPPPLFSPGPMSPKGGWTAPNSYQPPSGWGAMPPTPQGYYLPEEPRRRQSMPDRAKGNSNSNSKAPPPGRSKWRENIAAAGIGGAAASLLSVLTEAAADISI